MGNIPLTWDSAPELLDAEMVGALLSARPVWVRRHLRHIMTPLNERNLRWRKTDLLRYLEEQRVRASGGVSAVSA